jgi:hypothetical protein
MSFEIVPGRPGEYGRQVHDEHPVQDVGAFRQGTDASHWVLRRYLLTRALGASIVRTVHWLGIGILLLAALTWAGGIKWLAVLIALCAVFVLLIRVMLSGIQRRLSGSEQLGSAAPKVDALVGQTRKGLRAELRRVGLPAGPWGPLLIGLRLIRPFKRVQTVKKLSQIDLAKVVPPSRLDELHLLLASVPPSRP